VGKGVLFIAIETQVQQEFPFVTALIVLIRFFQYDDEK